MTAEPAVPEEKPAPAPPPGGADWGPKPPPGADMAKSPASGVFSRNVLSSQSGVVLILGFGSVFTAAACGIGVILAIVSIVLAMFVPEREKEDPSKTIARWTGLTMSIISLVVGGVFLIGFVASFT